MEKRRDQSPWNRVALIGAVARPRWRWLLTVLLLVGGLPAAMAQDPGSSDALDPVREKDDFTDTDDQAIDAWIAAQLDRLKEASAVLAAEPEVDIFDDGGAGPAKDRPEDEVIKAGQRFMRAFNRELTNEGNTSRFAARLAARSAQAFAAAYQQPQEWPALAVWYLPRVLLEMNRVDTRPGLLAGLTHPVPAVRYLSAKGLTRLRNDLARNTVQTQADINTLRDVGRNETDPVALGAVYEALWYADQQLQETSLNALSAVFAARLDRLREARGVVVDRAEITPWEYLRAARTRLGEAARARMVGQLAGFLAIDVTRYTTTKGESKATAAERIEACESLMQAFLTAGTECGDVRQAMKAGGADTSANMMAELAKWVGSENQQGCLNAAPWSVPVGGLAPQS